jgi:hypothetical protein
LRWLQVGAGAHLSAIILLIRRIHAFIGIVSANHHGDAPILEDLDESGNTIHSESNGELDNIAKSRYDHQGDSIQPVIDYESKDGSIEPLSEDLAASGTVLMAAPSTAQDPPPDPNMARNNANPNPNTNGGASKEDFLQTPIKANAMLENLEVIHLSLQERHNL